MIFTDDDLKRLKQASSVEGLFLNATIPEKIKALVARLKAAERICRWAKGIAPIDWEEAWLKAAGK